MQIVILGRQPHLGITELERLYGPANVDWFSDISATVKSTHLDVTKLGGSIKAGSIVAESSGGWRNVSQKIVRAYQDKWSSRSGKITLGISAYGFKVSAREVQKTGIILKANLKKQGINLRLIPNDSPELSSATSHHNKLGLSDNKIELLVIQNQSGKVIIAESTGAQNITALARRDQNRPKRDAFVGMLPPKLALMMVNLALGNYSPQASTERADVATRKSGASLTILDPFCGTGVLLQEAALLGLDTYGTDLSDKMIDYTKTNLDWLKSSHRLEFNTKVHQGDATDTTWQPPIDLIATETYLGQPFSAPPSPKKLAEVKNTCNTIVSKFLQNIGTQIKPGTPLCLAIPAWRAGNDKITDLPLIGNLNDLGYTHIKLKNATENDLIYYREDQVVARRLIILEKL